MKNFSKATKFCRQLTKALLMTIAVIFLFVTVRLLYVNHKTVENPCFTNGELKVIMIDVENGDCFLVLQNDEAFLVDTGFFLTYHKVNRVLEENNVKKINYAVITHPHRDHAGGIFGLLLSYRVDNLYMADDVKNMEMSFQDALFYYPMSAMIRYNDIFAKNVKQAENFQFSDSKVEFLGPIGKNYTKMNNYSLLFKLTYEKKSILFTGDMETLTERELLKANIDVSANILKIGHHGSNTSTSKEFLEAVNPEYAIVSCANGKHNNYGHPVERILRYLKERQIPLYRTDELGNVEFEISGNGIKMIQEARDYKSGRQLLDEINNMELTRKM